MRALVLAVSLAACASTQRPTTTTPQPTRRVRGEEFRVIGQTTETGRGDAYDAGLLYERAVAAMRANHCDEAAPILTRIATEFAGSRWHHPALYNRGICEQHASQWQAAVASFREASRDTVDASLVRDAWFRVAAVGEQATQPTWVIEAADAILARQGLTLTDRVEALARRAAARLHQQDLDGADRDAAAAIALAPTAEATHALEDDTHAAQARVVAAEVTRLRAAAITINPDADNLEAEVTRRANLVTHAHAQYNEAIRVGNPDWAAAAGFRIGEIYRDFYTGIVDATPPSGWDAPTREAYRRRSRERLRILLQGAIRSWESTLAMARRTGIGDNEWVRRTDAALNELRALILGGAESPSRKS